MTSFDTFVRSLGKYKLLTREEERETHELYKATGDTKYRDKLVNHNARYVLKCAHRYKYYGVDFEELFQEGILGLMRAIEKFDTSRGYKLISYATWFIRAYMQKHIMLVRHNVRRYKTQFERCDLFKESAKYNKYFELSLDAPLVENPEYTIMDTIAAANSHPVDQLIFDEESQEALNATFASCRDKRDAFIVHERVYTDDPVTFQQLGNELGLSRERVRQLERGILNRTREALAA